VHVCSQNSKISNLRKEVYSARAHAHYVESISQLFVIVFVSFGGKLIVKLYLSAVNIISTRPFYCFVPGCNIHFYTISQQERSIIWEIILSVILSKTFMCTRLPTYHRFSSEVSAWFHLTFLRIARSFSSAVFIFRALPPVPR
jgi:hypothetical protein